MKKTIALAAAFLVFSGLNADAQPYPSKPIRMYVGFSAGSATDIVARVVSKGLSERIGQPIVVDNKTGAGGSLAGDAVAKAAPDGYTLLTVSSAIAVNPAVYAKLPFDVEKDLIAISNVGTLPLVLLISRSVPATNLREFIQYAKTRPDALHYGSSGIGGSIQPAPELLNPVAGIKPIHVPFRGNSQAVTALMGAEVQVLVDTVLLAAPNLKSQKVTPLAITGTARSPLAPDLPTFAEGGLPGYNAGLFFGIMGPAGLPKAIVDKLNSEIGVALQTAKAQKRQLDTGAFTTPAGRTG